MNKNRKPVTAKTRKSMEKEVKKGQKKLKSDELPRTDTLTPKKALASYPAKRQKAEKPLMDNTAKGMQVKKKKATGKHSKRTTPGEVPHRESSPAHVHPESDVWQKTLNKQNKTKRVALTKKLEKQKPKRKIK